MTKIKDLRRRAFQKKERIMRDAIQQSLGMLMAIPDPDCKIQPIGSFLADALARESAVPIPDPRPPELIEAQTQEKQARKAARKENEEEDSVSLTDQK